MNNQVSRAATTGKNIVYIPARGKSSRLPGKALADLGGHPLISYTIRIANKIKGIDHVLVDTDCKDIKAVAEEYGAEVPFLRDSEYAMDKTSLTSTAQLFLERLHDVIGPVYKKINMMPTNPFRNIETINSLAKDLDSYLSVQTVLAADADISQLHFLHEGQRHSLLELATYNPVQYDWIKGFGYFHALYENQNWPRHLLLYNNFKYHVLTNPIELIDIDYPHDLAIARRIVADSMYDFGIDML